MEDGHEVILCSLVKKMATDAPDVTTQAHAFVIPHFGRVYLAEAIIDECKRTLTMLRLELGSPIAGSGVFAQSVAMPALAGLICILLLSLTSGCRAHKKESQFDPQVVYQDAWIKMKRGQFSAALESATAGFQKFPSERRKSTGDSGHSKRRS